jgi:S-adenosyl-L-methionine hydrolase (adenosine-forming)
MQLVTLTTDFGTRDYYAGALKGALLQQHAEMTIVDISHDIQPFDLVQAAFVLRNVWQEFPQGTIHLIGVNCVYDRHYRFVALQHQGHFFLAPDNGILYLLFGEALAEADVRSLGAGQPGHFPVKAVFAEATGHLAAGLAFDDLGEPAGALLQRISLQPVITQDRIRGTVVHIDNYDNVLVNVHRETFEKVRNGRPFSLFFKRNDPISRLSDNYCDVPLGEPLCLFNSAGYLEIAVNLGKAATLLGLKVEDVVEIVFE